MINAYDFDKTIYDGDSSVDFYLYCLKRKPSIILLIPGQIWSIILYLLKVRKKEYMKEKFFAILKKIDNIDLYIDGFWDKNFKKIKSWYLNQKEETDVIISASPEFLLKPLEKKLKIDKIIATKVNKITGKFESKNCHDFEKIIRYEKLYPKKTIRKFYTDSVSADKPMLEYAVEGYIVQKNKIHKWNRKW